MHEESFIPVDYCWAWTEDWYDWDSKKAHSEAMKARNARAKELEASGHRVKKYSSPKALMSRGGIGSGHPHIEVFCTVYHIIYS
jgi:hypothetical protein